MVECKWLLPFHKEKLENENEVIYSFFFSIHLPCFLVDGIKIGFLIFNP